MKKLFAALIATSVLATPFASAQAHDHRPPPPRHVEKKVIIEKRVVVKDHRWKKGRQLSRAERRQIINARDYRQYRLHEPRRGEQWVRVDNQYLLISAATGLILGLAAAN